MIGPVSSWAVGGATGAQQAYAGAVVSARADSSGSAPQDAAAFSPEAKAKANASKARAAKGTSKSEMGDVECETCRERRYVDGSDDPTVSFQSPQSVSPNAAASAVRAHESEHVLNEQIRAEQSGRKVVSQSVAIHTGVCPECGRIYVAGGTTTTKTVAKASSNQDGSAAQGKMYGRLDAVA